MHELGLCAAIVETARRRARGRRVMALRVRVGSLVHANDTFMGQAFELASEGTELEGANLDVVTVPALITCRACGHEGSANDRWAACGACGDPDVAISGGEDMMLGGSITPRQRAPGRDGMCLGIPGRIVEVDPAHPDVVEADVSGARRTVDLGLLGDVVEWGDWVLIHMGLALEEMTEERRRTPWRC